MVLPSSFGASCPSPNPHYSPSPNTPQQAAGSVIPLQSLHGIWRELCLCNVWENLGATIVLTQMLKGVRILTQHTYR
jgi:hypothetical protein